MTRRIVAIALLAGPVLIAAPDAWAQTAVVAHPPARLRLQMPAVGAASSPETRPFLPAQWVPAARRHAPPPRQLAGVVVGGLVGAYAGGLIGAKLGSPCLCDDGGPKGFEIGLKIGGVLGVIAGMKIASR
jgi:hypothetical protein